MSIFGQTGKLYAATLFSIVLISGAYFLAKTSGNPPRAEASTESALLQAIASRDSDGDGLPDWEEALYGTDPHNPNSTGLGMNDGDAVAKGLLVPKAIATIPVATSTPRDANNAASTAKGLPTPASGSLTDLFANTFLSLYTNAKELKGGATLTSADIQNLQNEALNDLISTVEATADYKTAKEIAVSGSGNAALISYAQNVEAVFRKNATDATKDEIQYLKDALQNDNVDALPHIVGIAQADRNTAIGLSVLPVPQELASAHLELVNALMRIGQIINDFGKVNTDPLTTVLGLEQYDPATRALAQAFADVGKVYASAGVHLPTGSPGAAFLTVAANAKGI